MGHSRTRTFSVHNPKLLPQCTCSNSRLRYQLPTNIWLLTRLVTGNRTVRQPKSPAGTSREQDRPRRPGDPTAHWWGVCPPEWHVLCGDVGQGGWQCGQAVHRDRRAPHGWSPGHARPILRPTLDRIRLAARFEGGRGRQRGPRLLPHVMSVQCCVCCRGREAPPVSSAERSHSLAPPWRKRAWHCSL